MTYVTPPPKHQILKVLNPRCRVGFLNLVKQCNVLFGFFAAFARFARDKELFGKVHVIPCAT